LTRLYVRGVLGVVCIFALIALVVFVCVAVRVCNLDYVELSWKLWKLLSFSVKVKGRDPRQPRGRNCMLTCGDSPSQMCRAMAAEHGLLGAQSHREAMICYRLPDPGT
jgi:hypothetical protein